MEGRGQVYSRSERPSPPPTTDHRRQVYSRSEQEAALLMSLPYSVSALACPVLGCLVDSTGPPSLPPPPRPYPLPPRRLHRSPP